MNREELEELIEKLYPEMISHKNFMDKLTLYFCDKTSVNFKDFSEKEYDTFLKIRQELNIATVEYLIDYLQKNFKPDDKLCYMDCVEGVKNDCVYIKKDKLGNRFFYYVLKMKERSMKKLKTSKRNEDKMFPYVKDNDVVLI